MTEAVCYTMDLYCDVQPDWDKPLPRVGHSRYESFPQQYLGPNRSFCKKEAKKDGWRYYYGDRRHICPKCVKLGLGLGDIND